MFQPGAQGTLESKYIFSSDTPEGINPPVTKRIRPEKNFQLRKKPRFKRVPCAAGWNKKKKGQVRKMRKAFIMEKTLRELAPSGKNIYVNYKRNTMAVAMGTIDELEMYWNCEGILSKEGRMGYQFTITHERR